MKYYSDTLKEFFNSEKECVMAEKKAAKEQKEAEEKANQLKVEREARAKEVENALQAVYDAEKTYKELLDKFLDDYGSFHYSKHKDNCDPSDFSLFDLFPILFK